ncbi:hypothetical protein HPB52_025005 [Rhipicephalus sanguineus]|uniref:Uncharacterized protein n=1 Tax=Rhipicephalus sanguineus TaxID=34632 RepID=A0A9D4TDN7_RHISA|nr:hypothetical protein HPB52_025005 [Rhipicephalus sanguineus]
MNTLLPPNLHEGHVAEEDDPDIDDSLAIPDVDHREVIKDELRKLTSKPPPRAYQGYRLWEIVRRFLDAEDIKIDLNAYLREVLANDRVKPQRQPVCPPDGESRRQAKKRQYALTQELFRKNRTRSARRVLDGDADSKVEDPSGFLEEWREIMERVVPASVSPNVQRPRQVIDPMFLITVMDIKMAMLPSNSASGPDGFSAKELRKAPVTALQVFLNLLMLQK